MPSITITNIDNGSVQLDSCELRPDVLNLAGADELKEGTILARDSVSLKLRLYVKGGTTNENGIPKVVLAHAVSAAGAGDQQVRVISRGDVVKERLVIDADGNATNVDAAVIDQLRSYGINPVDVQQLGRVDNPQP